MFGLFGIPKELKMIASNIIAPSIHEQIYGALADNEPVASKRLTECFVISYFIGYCVTTFQSHGFNGQESLSKTAKFILDGIIPRRLDELFDLHTAKAKLAKDLESRGGEFAEFMTLWRKGAEIGRFDAENKLPHGLSRFLIGDELVEFEEQSVTQTLDAQTPETAKSDVHVKATKDVENIVSKNGARYTHQDIIQIVAPQLKRQLMNANEANYSLAQIMIEQGFTYGYLERFLSKSFEIFGLSDVEDGVDPFGFETIDELCDLLRIDGLREILVTSHSDLYLKVSEDRRLEKKGESWDKGISAGLEDALRYFASETRPEALMQFLTGRVIDGERNLTVDSRSGEYNNLLKAAKKNARANW